MRLALYPQGSRNINLGTVFFSEHPQNWIFSNPTPVHDRFGTGMNPTAANLASNERNRRAVRPEAGCVDEPVEDGGRQQNGDGADHHCRARDALGLGHEVNGGVSIVRKDATMTTLNTMTGCAMRWD